MKLISRVTVYDQQTGAEFTIEPRPVIALDEMERRQYYQIKLTPGEAALIYHLFSMLRPVVLKLPRWVGQNKRG